MGNKKVEGKGGWIREKQRNRRKEKQQRESDSKTWVVKDEMLLEHFILKDPNVYALFNILEQISHIPFPWKNLVSTF